MISVVDYGVANLGSILNMLKKIGVKARLVSTPEGIDSAESIILPGVGSFDQGVSALKSLGLNDVIKRRVLDDKVPILGICLGMQLLGRGSGEGELDGLSLIDARCERFSFGENASLKIPHMGWNTLIQKKSSRILQGLDGSARFYFVHSYQMVCTDPGDVLATADYGGEFTAMVQRGNISGAQFHPEKSHRFGMQLLRNFADT
jgi:imidazole glycerol-phosphate synthase subunit HisH